MTSFEKLAPSRHDKKNIEKEDQEWKKKKKQNDIKIIEVIISTHFVCHIIKFWPFILFLKNSKEVSYLKNRKKSMNERNLHTNDFSIFYFISLIFLDKNVDEKKNKEIKAPRQNCVTQSLKRTQHAYGNRKKDNRRMNERKSFM